EQYFKDRILAGDPNYAAKSTSFKKYIVGNPFNKTEENSNLNKAEQKNDTGNNPKGQVTAQNHQNNNEVNQTHTR
ncbi:MAG: hypothetical protein ACI398_03335, partial [Clostridium sp.]